ncbi:MAG: hypothetical protein ACT4QC_08705 [Planctomycetaceae bacterium]
MPATENVWRNLRTMHIVFAVSAVAMFAATLWMMQADYDDEWRPTQRVGFKLQAEQVRQEERALRTTDFEAQEQELQRQIDAAKEKLKHEDQAKKEAQADVNGLDAEFQKLNREVKFQRAERDKARADLDLQVRDGTMGTALRPWLEAFDTQQTKTTDLETRLQELQGRFDAAKARFAELTKVRDDALAAKKKHDADLAKLEKTLAQIAPEDWGRKFKRWLMELPIIEGFNGPLKINQIWLPELKIGYGGMAQVARFDRCVTCHMNIDKVAPGNVPQFPHDPHGISLGNAALFLAGKGENGWKKAAGAGPAGWAHEDGTPVGYAHPYSSHPQPELYLTASSPHPMQKFGCTGCHEGQGSGTIFQNASHTPNSPDIGEKWHEDYGYSYNHFWEYPMYPKRLAEAACVKCHHSITELGVNPKFGASAPQLYRGWDLVRQYGCFGCHEINGYNAGKPIGPDLRLEPQTKEEVERIAADPAAVAGTMRKVGPGLRNFASKTNRDWAHYWIADPKRFRPETRMPKFFDLVNQDDAQAKELQPVEIAGIVEFLFAKSENLPLDSWAHGYTPNAERGKLLFSQRGCLACHSHGDFPDIKQDFGPNLTNAHQKLTNAKWLYTWLREPTRHSARTRMPNLYLEPETVKNETIDPAADIAAYLMSKGPGDFAKMKAPAPYLGITAGKPLDAHAAGRLGLDRLRGVRVSSVILGSAAARAVPESAPADVGATVAPTRLTPLEINDVILKWNDTEVISSGQLTQLAAETPAGAPVVLTVWRNGREIKVRVAPETPLSDLARLYLSKVLTFQKVDDTLASRRYPETDAARIRAAAIQPDEIELVQGELTDETLLRYVGRRTISRYGCYGCHDIPGFERARPIGTGLADWGRKDPTKLALEHIEEYLHHHGETDGSSTAKRAEKAVRNGYMGNLPPDVYEKESSVAFFYDQLLHHGRAGFLWQKLREPRSYDYKKTETKNWDERLRMPKFPFDESEIEAIATFILGLVAEPPAEKYVYRAQGAAHARVEGEKLLQKYNCTGCHTVELPEVIGRPSDLEPDELATADWPEAFDLLKKLKPPRDARTPFKTKSGQPAISFHGLLFQPPDPEDDPADQAYYYSLWETLHLGNPDEVLLPGRRMEILVKDLLAIKPPRGGEFAGWLAEASMKADRDVNRDKAQQMVPPVLYLEGQKVQTPWLYRFLKNPERIRYTTVLRMPQFNMNNDEARALANYFSAVDGTAYPYQDVPQRDPEYLVQKERDNPEYLRDAWKLLTMPPPTGLCNGCHAVGGLPFVGGGDPTKVTHAPNLEGAYNRLRPEWLELWIYKPSWITPYTAMPQNFPRDKQQFPHLFEGDGSRQTVAARDALMNYLRILEREGKATAAAPQAAAPAQGSNND